MIKSKLLLLFWVFGVCVLRAQTPAEGLKPGDLAADFRLKNTDGKMVSQGDYKNAKGFIIVFTCNTCPFAQAYEQRIIDLHKKYEPLGFPVIAINANDAGREPGDSYEKMCERAKEKQYPFAYLQDETQETAKRYGATRTPHVFLLSKARDANYAVYGNRLVYVGAIDDNYEEPAAVKEHFLENALNETLQGKVVSKHSTKAIGCGIKWRKPAN